MMREMGEEVMGDRVIEGVRATFFLCRKIFPARKLAHLLTQHRNSHKAFEAELTGFIFESCSSCRIALWAWLGGFLDGKMIGDRMIAGWWGLFSCWN